ncbi:uncharacterized protein LOC113849725 isoform X1 [Abrus precatorius]|uniref:Uncharacterized protein LOC113849725 isoform X1 n=1 Tax=Abrus precatorius TaxID=3816 RepID=A0A8B8JVT9_ABRPR|nr:uncharacterized protein LOC113849725 isoform X1 [Abrus precatorius]
MQALRLRLSSSEARPLFRLRSYLLYSSSCCSAALLNLNSLPSPPSASSMSTNLFTFPWSAFQCRGIKVSGSDIRVGNIIGKQGRIYEVLKVDHSHEGRGKATIKVELRDIGQGNKVTQRMGTDEDIERVFVRERTFMFMCMDHDGTVVLMDPDTLDQMEVSKDLFGKNCLYLQDEMKVKVQFYDDKPLSASVPKRVTCNVKEGIAATPRNKKVVLDNGLSVEVPPHIVAGDAIVVNTEDDSYIERAKA